MSDNMTLERTETTLDKSAIRDFAVNARKKLKAKVEQQANKMGFFSDGRVVQYEFEDDYKVKINGEFYPKAQIKILNDKFSKNFDSVIDEVAYTWFNRFIALYYMECHNYIENGLNIISSIDDLNQTAIKAPNYFKNLNKEELFASVQANNSDEVYKKLIIAQCNELNKKLPFLFEEISNYTELLFPAGMLNNDSVIREMLALDKKNWEEVEIIGWLYQYYIAEVKETLDAELKKNKKKKVQKEDMPAKTQIFTPKWIVKYLVENSIGKSWLELYPNSNLQSKFKYYVNSVEQEEDVKQITSKNIKPEEIKVLDPACGSGHILVYAFTVLYEIYKSAGYLEDEIAPLILKNNLFGLDICDRAAQLAQLAVVMKAREYDKNISDKVTELNITSIQESNWIDSRVKEALLNGVENRILANAQIDLLINSFKDAKEYGSIINIKDFDFDFWNERLNAIQSLNMGLLYIDVAKELQEKLPPLIKQSKIMQQHYNTVISNPPYLGNTYMSPLLVNFVKNKYKNTKTDLYSIFMKRNFDYIKKDGYIGMITPPSWLFLNSFEELRLQIINNQTIVSLLHMGRGIFGVDYGSSAFIFKNSQIKNYNGSFFRLHQRTFQAINSEDIEKIFLSSIKDKNFKFNFATYKANQEDNEDITVFGVDNKPQQIYFSCKQSNYKMIPGSPIAYWASDKIRHNFSHSKSLGVEYLPRQGLATSDNARFLRYWNEVSFDNIEFNCHSHDDLDNIQKKWFPYNKGGDYRKWYGNYDFIVNWFNNGEEIKEFTSKLPQGTSVRLKSQEYYFKDSITWSALASTNFGARYCKEGCLFDVAGSCIFPPKDMQKYVLALLNSKISNYNLYLLNPTLNFQISDIRNLPLIYPNECLKNKIDNIVTNNISISKDDWDSFETSWDFKIHPLLRFSNFNKGLVDYKNIHSSEPITLDGFKIKHCFEKWAKYKQEQFNKLKANEEELNRLFIEIYGLQDEMDSKVEDKDITLKGAFETEKDCIKSLLSYAVGCMLGRYSLDEEGLAFAGGTFDCHKYNKLEVDEDGILPILSGTWFEDDIIEELKRFLKVAFGDICLSENMEYIADVLGRKSGESAENTIRNYFLRDFYKDHLNIYSIAKGGKRPIYWMFTSGKEKAFNCLVYLHRYDKTTLSRIRKDYLHEFQAKLDRAIIQAEEEGNVKLTSLYAKYKKELQDFDAKIKDLADAQIELNLDDGVKVNYGKFKGLLEAEKDIVGKDK